MTAMVAHIELVASTCETRALVPGECESRWLSGCFCSPVARALAAQVRGTQEWTHFINSPEVMLWCQLCTGLFNTGFNYSAVLVSYQPSLCGVSPYLSQQALWLICYGFPHVMKILVRWKFCCGEPNILKNWSTGPLFSENFGPHME